MVSGDPSSGVFSHGYDTAGRLISETNPQSQVMGYTLDDNGNATRITYPGGYYVERVYDQLDRLTDIKLNGSGSSSVVFGYDQLSRRTAKNYANGVNRTYTYDLSNNLLTMNIAFMGSSSNWIYTYNKVHQMLTSNCSDTNYYWRATAGTVSYATANNLNQYPTIGGLAATYDSLGALATYNTWTYTYNTEQMLIAASKSGTSASFVYDPKLRQIEKTVGSDKTKYVYSGSHMMEEWDNVAGTLSTRYVYAGAEEPVLQMTSAGVLTYIHHDHHGSVIAQSSPSTGAVTSVYKYGPFGESAATLPGTTIGYTGQRYDTELGLYHYKARYFHPGIGRFLQPDPVGYSAGMNLYAYCSNDGLNHTDPDGLEPAWTRDPWVQEANKNAGYIVDGFTNDPNITKILDVGGSVMGFDHNTLVKGVVVGAAASQKPGSRKPGDGDVGTHKENKLPVGDGLDSSHSVSQNQSKNLGINPNETATMKMEPANHQSDIPKHPNGTSINKTYAGDLRAHADYARSIGRANEGNIVKMIQIDSRQVPIRKIIETLIKRRL